MNNNTSPPFCIWCKHILFFTLALTLSVAESKAQNPHSELWGTYTTKKYLNNKRYWVRNDIGVREAFTSEPITTLLIRPRLVINAGDVLELIPAVDFRYSFIPETPNAFEIRTWQGAQLHWPQIKRVMFDHLYRFEQRFHFIEGSANDEIGLRSRYRFRARIPINKPAITNNTLFTDLRCEAYIPHDNNIHDYFANTIRWGLTLGYNHSSNWRYYLIFFVDRGKITEPSYAQVLTDRKIISVVVRNTF